MFYSFSLLIVCSNFDVFTQMPHGTLLPHCSAHVVVEERVQKFRRKLLLFASQNSKWKGCFFARFDGLVLYISIHLTHRTPSLLYKKTPGACNYQSSLSSVLCKICLSWFSICNFPRTGVTALNVFRLNISLVFYPSNKTAKLTSNYASI